VEAALNKLTVAAKIANQNLLEACVVAARAKATLGEMSYALEKVFGRHKAPTQMITGVFSKEMKQNQGDISKVIQRVKTFHTQHGRPPRILVAKIGQDGHDRGQKVIATAFADMGFDVDVGPLFQTPEETAKQAIENDVHVVGMSSLAAGHLTLVPSLKKELTKQGRADILIVVGGVIPPDDDEALFRAGAVAIFRPGTMITKAALELVDKIEKNLL